MDRPANVKHLFRVSFMLLICSSSSVKARSVSNIRSAYRRKVWKTCFSYVLIFLSILRSLYSQRKVLLASNFRISNGTECWERHTKTAAGSHQQQTHEFLLVRNTKWSIRMLVVYSMQDITTAIRPVRCLSALPLNSKYSY